MLGATIHLVHDDGNDDVDHESGATHDSELQELDEVTLLDASSRRYRWLSGHPRHDMPDEEGPRNGCAHQQHPRAETTRAIVEA